MTEEERKAAEAKEREDAARKDAEEKAKADADVGTKLDNLLSHISDMAKRVDSMEEERKADRARKDAEEKEREDRAKKDAACPRMDGESDEAWEKRKEDKAKKDMEGDPEKVAADKKRKDAEDEKEREEKEKADRAKKDAEEEEEKKAKADAADLRKRLSDVEKVVLSVRDRAPEDKAKFAEVQARHDSVYQAFGDSAPAPLQGETLPDYERRLTGDLKKHSKDLKGVNLHAIADATAFSAIQERIFADAVAAANTIDDTVAGDLIPRERTVRGHTTIEYRGSPRSWMDSIAYPGGQRQYVTEIKR